MRNANQHRGLLALAWLLLALLTTAVHGVANGQAQARVYLAPAEPVLAAGETTQLTIRVAGAMDLYGVELHLQYDPAVLAVLDADASRAGVQLSPGDMLDPAAGFPVANRADNQTGELNYAITLLAPAEVVSGDGVLVSFEVQALADGSSELALSAILASAEGISLPVTAEGGWLTVGSGQSSRPSPTAAETTAGQPATPSATPTAAKTPTAASQSPGQSLSATPAAVQSTPTVVQAATAAGALSTSEGQPGAGDGSEGAQAGPGETAAAVAGLGTVPVTAPAGTEDQAAAGGQDEPRPSPEFATIAPPNSDASDEAGQGDNAYLAGGLVVVTFVLIALVIFFGRRLLRRKL